MADQSRSGKLKRLVKVQRHLEHMAENDLATTTRARAEVAEDLDAVVNAIGSVNSIHQLFASIYSSQISRLTAKDLKLSTDLYDPTKHYNEVRDKFIGIGPSVQ